MGQSRTNSWSSCLSWSPAVSSLSETYEDMNWWPPLMFLKVIGSGSSFGTSHILSEARDECHLLNPWLILQWSCFAAWIFFPIFTCPVCLLFLLPCSQSVPEPLVNSLSSVQLLSHGHLCDPMDAARSGLSGPSTSLPGVYSNSCPFSKWWHSTVSSSVIPLSSVFEFSYTVLKMNI